MSQVLALTHAHVRRSALRQSRSILTLISSLGSQTFFTSKPSTAPSSHPPLSSHAQTVKAASSSSSASSSPVSSPPPSSPPSSSSPSSSHHGVSPADEKHAKHAPATPASAAAAAASAAAAAVRNGPPPPSKMTMSDGETPLSEEKMQIPNKAQSASKKDTVQPHTSGTSTPPSSPSSSSVPHTGSTTFGLPSSLLGGNTVSEPNIAKKKNGSETLPNLFKKPTLRPLPTALIPWEEEFRSQSKLSRAAVGFARRWRYRVHQFKSMTLKFFEPGVIALLTTTTALAYGIGAVESLHYLNPEFVLSQPEVAEEFIRHYASDQLLASFAAANYPAQEICVNMGVNPAIVLLQHPEIAHQTVPAYEPFVAGTNPTTLSFLRIALTHLVMVTMLVRFVQDSVEIRNIFQDRVRRGLEPPLRGSGERIIRLCGEKSDVTTLSLDRYGPDYILPIFEDPSKLHPRVISHHSRGGKTPAYWHVSHGSYGSTDRWRSLVEGALDSHVLVETSKGEKVLYIEADGTNSEDSLRFTHSSTDLNVADATMGMRLLHHEVRRSKHFIGESFRTMRVFLGYTNQQIPSGGGRSQTVRERLIDYNEVDVVIDAISPILIQILRWTIDVMKMQWHSTIIFDTNNAEAFVQMKGLLAKYGFNVVDTSAVFETNRRKMPRFIYYSSTEETVHHLASLFNNHYADPTMCCALIEKSEGIELLNFMETKDSCQGLTTICPAETFDDLFRRVRMWTRQGHSPSAIQMELDARFSEVSDLAAQIAERHSSNKTATATPEAPPSKK